MLSNYMTLKKEKHYKKDKLFYKKQMGNNKDNKELKWDNHSKVMFDYSLIPKEQIR